MAWSFSEDKPIFQQLADGITLDIVRGKYAPGERLESVRDLAVKAGVNPNTVQRALAFVESTGLIFTKRGDGRFVGTDSRVVEAVRKKYVRQKTDEFIGALKAVGLNGEEILSEVSGRISSETINEQGEEINE